MTASKFLLAVQARGARISVSASATRNQGSGVIEPARAFLARLDLNGFATPHEAKFRSHLNKSTSDLIKTFPSNSGSWGLARKLLNIFLRDALYTSYLCEEFQLRTAESFLEVPLDSISGGRIYKERANATELPRWPGVKHNSPEISALYQEVATRIARRASFARVHLDTFWWGERKVDNKA